MLTLTSRSYVDRHSGGWSGDVQVDNARYVDGDLLQSSGTCASVDKTTQLSQLPLAFRARQACTRG